jgi:hypothetical protein
VDVHGEHYPKGNIKGTSNGPSTVALKKPITEQVPSALELKLTDRVHWSFIHQNLSELVETAPNDNNHTY